MKKLLAVILALAMMLGTCALADSLRCELSDARVMANGVAQIDLTGMGVELLLQMASAEDLCMQLTCNAGGAPLATAMVGLTGNTAMFGYGEAELTSVYTIDVGQYFDGDARAAMAAVYASLGALFAQGWQRASDGTSVGALAGAIPDFWVTSSGEMPHNGENCDITAFEIPHVLVAQWMDMLMAAADAMPEVQAGLSQFGVNSIGELISNVRISGIFYGGASADELVLIVDLGLMGTPAKLTFQIVDTALENGESFSLGLSVSMDNQQAGVGVDVALETVSDDSWAQIDLDGAMSLDAALSTPGAADQVTEKIGRDLKELAGIVTAGAMGVLTDNMSGAAQ